MTDPQRDLDRKVWCRIEESGVKRWRKGDPVPIQGRRLLIGLASYSALDLELTQDLINQLGRRTDLALDLFNVLDVRDMGGFDDYIPGIGKVYQTPVLGFWDNGKLVRTAQGFAARQLARSLAIDSDDQ